MRQRATAPSCDADRPPGRVRPKRPSAGRVHSEEAFDRDLETERVEAMPPLIKGSDSGNQFLCGKVRNS
jgi:hypothetical protein